MSVDNILTRAFAAAARGGGDSTPAIYIEGGRVLKPTYAFLAEAPERVAEHMLSCAALTIPKIMTASVTTAGGSGGTATIDASTEGAGVNNNPYPALLIEIDIPEGVPVGQQVLTITANNRRRDSVAQSITFQPHAPQKSGAAKVRMVCFAGETGTLGNTYASDFNLAESMGGTSDPLVTEQNLVAALSSASPNNVGLSVTAIGRANAEFEELALTIARIRAQQDTNFARAMRAAGQL
jgi:hypothetical protein